MDVIGQGPDRPPRRTRSFYRPPKPVVVVVSLCALAAAAAGLLGTAGRPHHRVSAVAPSHASPTPAASASTGAAEAVPVEVAALLQRPLHLPLLRNGRACPVSAGHPIPGTGGGIGPGTGPVHPLLFNPGDPRHGVVTLGPTDTPGWLALDVVWLSQAGYQGPLTVRVQRLNDPQPRTAYPAAVSDPADLSTALGYMWLPAGAGDNTYLGYRAVPAQTWVKSAGCYAWQVDGNSFSEVIVIDARPARPTP